MPKIYQYKSGRDAYFSSPSYELLAKPPFANLITGVNGENLVQRVKESLRFAKELGHKNTIVVGAVPFDTVRPSYLRLSTNTEFNGKCNSGSLIEVDSPKGKDQPKYGVQTESGEYLFKASIKKALNLFETGALKKVVLSRTLRVFSATPFDIPYIVQRLEKYNSSGYTFAFDLINESMPSQKGSATLVGVSPELLITVRDGKFFANPLAGSEPRNSNLKEEQLLCEKLLSSKKDLHEHSLVIDDVVKVLNRYCININVQKRPSIVKTPTMLHLSKEISGDLSNPSTSSIELALALHPTPAVCGTPRMLARQAISKLERYDRDAFTGIVGWCDEHGNGDWAVTIRCAKIFGRNATLYAGAGIVKGSCPNKEWHETGAKFKTMLNAIGI